MADNSARAAISITYWLMLSAWLLYVVSLALPTVRWNGQAVPGFQVLYIGMLLFITQSWVDLWGLLAVSSWLTNFAFWTTWFIYRKAKKGRLKPLVWVAPVCFVVNVTMAVSAPSGIREHILIGLFKNPGYYAWVASFAVASFAIYWAVRNARSAI